MIDFNKKSIGQISVGSTPIARIMRGTKLVWEMILSCIAKGYWINKVAWRNDKRWRN